MAKPFQQWLASSVPAIGEADVKNAGSPEQDLVDSAISVNGTPSASGVDKAKGSKRSKKKA